MVRDERIGEKSFTLFQKIMKAAKSVKCDDPMWESARLSMRGAFSPIARVPQVGDLKMVLDFLHHHLSSQRRIASGDEPIYHSFRAIASSPGAGICRGLTLYDFTSPLFIGVITQALSNKGYRGLQEMAIIALSELDSQLFTSDKAFKDRGKARNFVASWWTAVESCSTSKLQQVDRATAQVFFAIVNLPCLREYIPPEAWDITDTFHYILEANPPSLQRCTQNSELLAFVKQVSPKVGLPSWMALLWMKHDSLPKDVLDQMEEETRKTVYKECETNGEATLITRTRYCKTWISISNGYLTDWEERLGNLDPSDQAVPGLQARRDSAIKARERLIEIREEVKSNPPPARWFWEPA